MSTIESLLNGLTEKELVEWAGSTIVSRGKSYVNSVSELSQTEDGRLVAWVFGSDEYVTTVRRNAQGEIDYTCTCPYDHGGACKHVVAVLLAAIEELKQKKEIPLIDPESELHSELYEHPDVEAEPELLDGDDDWYLSERKLGEIQQEVGSMLQNKSRDELLKLLGVIVRDFPEVACWLHEQEQMATGNITDMVQSLRKEIRTLTVHDVWSSGWEEDFDSADFEDVEERLRALLGRGYADAVFELGQELWERSAEQVERFDDEGETADAIADCMNVVLKALPDTKLSRLEQLTWLFERLSEDQYDLLAGSQAVLDDTRYSKADWRALAAALEERLRTMPVPRPDRWDRQYCRCYLVDQLTDVYRRAEQPEKVIALLEKEAEPCLHYDVLVEHLLAAGEVERARSWCIEGYGKTLEHAPGTASTLRQRLRELAEKEGNLALAAAYRAQDFFRYPSVDAFTMLREAAEKIDAWPTLREALLGYLQSGKRPDGSVSGSAWPLPDPEVVISAKPESTGNRSFPKFAELIEIAILEERNDDVVALFKQMCQTAFCGRTISEQVAEAVATSHPDIALKIWRITVDNLISEVKTRAYQEAAGYLGKMHAVYRQAERLDEWDAMVAELRTRHKAKRRLMQVLNELETNG